MLPQEENTNNFGSDMLLIAYAGSSFLAFVLAFSKDLSGMQSASCFAISCVLALIGMNISKDTYLQAIDLGEDDEDLY